MIQLENVTLKTSIDCSQRPGIVRARIYKPDLSSGMLTSIVPSFKKFAFVFVMFIRRWEFLRTHGRSIKMILAVPLVGYDIRNRNVFISRDFHHWYLDSESHTRLLPVYHKASPVFLQGRIGLGNVVTPEDSTRSIIFSMTVTTILSSTFKRTVSPELLLTSRERSDIVQRHMSKNSIPVDRSIDGGEDQSKWLQSNKNVFLNSQNFHVVRSISQGRHEIEVVGLSDKRAILPKSQGFNIRSTTAFPVMLQNFITDNFENKSSVKIKQNSYLLNKCVVLSKFQLREKDKQYLYDTQKIHCMSMYSTDILRDKSELSHNSHATIQLYQHHGIESTKSQFRHSSLYHKFDAVNIVSLPDFTNLQLFKKSFTSSNSQIPHSSRAKPSDNGKLISQSTLKMRNNVNFMTKHLYHPNITFFQFQNQDVLRKNIKTAMHNIPVRSLFRSSSATDKAMLMSQREISGDIPVPKYLPNDGNGSQIPVGRSDLQYVIISHEPESRNREESVPNGSGVTAQNIASGNNAITLRKPRGIAETPVENLTIQHLGELADKVVRIIEEKYQTEAKRKGLI